MYMYIVRIVPSSWVISRATGVDNCVTFCFYISFLTTIITETCYITIPLKSTLTTFWLYDLLQTSRYCRVFLRRCSGCCEHQVFHERCHPQFPPPLHTCTIWQHLDIMILTIVVIWGFLIRKLFIKFTFTNELCGHYYLRAETIVLVMTSHRWHNDDGGFVEVLGAVPARLWCFFKL